MSPLLANNMFPFSMFPTAIASYCNCNTSYSQSLIQTYLTTFFTVAFLLRASSLGVSWLCPMPEASSAMRCSISCLLDANLAVSSTIYPFADISPLWRNVYTWDYSVLLHQSSTTRSSYSLTLSNSALIAAMTFCSLALRFSLRLSSSLAKMSLNLYKKFMVCSGTPSLQYSSLTQSSCLLGETTLYCSRDHTQFCFMSDRLGDETESF